MRTRMIRCTSMEKKLTNSYLYEFKKALTDGQLTGDFSLKEKAPADSHFVLGDNRRNSKDYGRHWFYS